MVMVTNGQAQRPPPEMGAGSESSVRKPSAKEAEEQDGGSLERTG